MDPLVTTLMVPLRFVVGVLAAAVALTVMGLAMPRFPDGDLPPLVAAGVLTNRRPDGISGNLADTIHYVGGLLGGPVFVWLTLLFEGVLGGASIIATVLAMVVLYAFVTGFFLLVVLPRSRVADLRVPRIQRAWLFSVAIYVLVLAPLTAVGTGLL